MASESPAGSASRRSQNSRATYALDRSEHIPFIQTYKTSVGRLAALRQIPTFCVPQVDLDGADLQNLCSTYIFGRSEHTRLRQTYEMKGSHLVALCQIPTL